jgi:hypothetical protein
MYCLSLASTGVWTKSDSGSKMVTHVGGQAAWRRERQAGNKADRLDWEEEGSGGLTWPPRLRNGDPMARIGLFPAAGRAGTDSPDSRFSPGLTRFMRQAGEQVISSASCGLQVCVRRSGNTAWRQLPSGSQKDRGESQPLGALRLAGGGMLNGGRGRPVIGVGPWCKGSAAHCYSFLAVPLPLADVPGFAPQSPPRPRSPVQQSSPKSGLGVCGGRRRSVIGRERPEPARDLKPMLVCPLPCSFSSTFSFHLLSLRELAGTTSATAILLNGDRERP